MWLDVVMNPTQQGWIISKVMAKLLNSLPFTMKLIWIFFSVASYFSQFWQIFNKVSSFGLLKTSTISWCFLSIYRVQIKNKCSKDNSRINCKRGTDGTQNIFGWLVGCLWQCFYGLLLWRNFKKYGWWSFKQIFVMVGVLIAGLENSLWSKFYSFHNYH